MDSISKAKRSKVMSSIRSKNTKPELVLRKALWSRGFRYRIHYGREKIDIAFPSQKIAIFIDGCFWHGCAQHGTWPVRNASFWRGKIESNMARDRDTDRRLAEEGWLAVRVWEHEDPEMAAMKIARLVGDRRSNT